MAGEDRAQAHDLIDWQAIERDLPRVGPFALLRRLEARAQAKPRLGKARRPEQSIVDLAQDPHLGFAARSLTALERKHGRARLRGTWLGLIGPMGPLPTHVTEAVWYERNYAKSHPLGDWLDLIAGRMLQLFYRAWAESQPATHADRPGDDRFSLWLSALSGAMEGTDEEASFFARARVHYAALFSGSRSAVALQDGLSHLLTQPVQVIEYVPKWRALEPEDYSRLGRSYATLGSDALLGKRVYSAADAFRVVVRAQNLDDYRSLMPEGERFAVAAEAIESFKPSYLEWDLCVEIAEDEAPALRLGDNARLGWSSWTKRVLADKKPVRRRRGKAYLVSGPVRADAHLRKTSAIRRKPAA